MLPPEDVIVETALDIAREFCQKQMDALKEDLDRVLRVAVMIKGQRDLYFSIGYDHVLSKPGVNVWPANHDVSRKVVGELIRETKMKPTFRKWDEAQAEARFELEDMTIMVNSYKGKNCRFITKEVVIPAEPERIIPAKEERIEKKIVMECDLD